jgi:hypothetical protein
MTTWPDTKSTSLSIPLTEEQALAVAASGEGLPALVDPKNQAEYVLMRRDLYERLAREDLSVYRP